ncbi:60S ribosomal protein L6 [Theileria orientalis strain Shintoku]|uniref:60S ribosomal protein L6 n=1 Tax=Theileria orientalis strain Shintoku TaxID=869250 RepID=J4CE04_THEOR|nr:60S ribosomal protein L6 [Theileria orientalis strain Shintoku]PVC51397.1 60S ribosomal protein L6 [Theileria orientalis]BAM42047.1 60S ribosomal protein L6 [Theileria orientalis strain Shintoku]|eukprot:XP_009692348.1 60S ribosomal protein L6 [Theileria orientalis strain Shintoku]
MTAVSKVLKPKVKLTRRKKVETRHGRLKVVGRKYASAPKVRESLKPGVVLILLTGGYKGKRVVLLKVLKSGLLLVTGPFSFNGVPLRRVNARYVIATSTNVFEFPEVDGEKLRPALEAAVADLGDEHFGKSSATKLAEFKDRKKKNKSKDSMFVDEPEVAAKSEELKAKLSALQDRVDRVLVPHLKKSELLTKYLKSRFTLRNNMFPHLLKF